MNFVHDPTTGTLVIRPDAYSKIERAILCELCVLLLGIKVRLAKLAILELLLEVRRFLLNLGNDLRRRIPNCIRDGHGTSRLVRAAAPC